MRCRPPPQTFPTSVSSTRYGPTAAHRPLPRLPDGVLVGRVRDLAGLKRSVCLTVFPDHVDLDPPVGQFWFCVSVLPTPVDIDTVTVGLPQECSEAVLEFALTRRSVRGLWRSCHLGSWFLVNGSLVCLRPSTSEPHRGAPGSGESKGIPQQGLHSRIIPWAPTRMAVRGVSSQAQSERTRTTGPKLG